MIGRDRVLLFLYGLLFALESGNQLFAGVLELGPHNYDHLTGHAHHRQHSDIDAAGKEGNYQCRKQRPHKHRYVDKGKTCVEPHRIEYYQQHRADGQGI